MPTIHIPGIDNGDSNDGQVHPPVPALYMDLSLNLQIVLTDQIVLINQRYTHHKTSQLPVVVGQILKFSASW